MRRKRKPGKKNKDVKQNERNGASEREKENGAKKSGCLRSLEDRKKEITCRVSWLASSSSPSSLARIRVFFRNSRKVVGSCQVVGERGRGREMS